MFIIKHRVLFFIISLIAVVLALTAIVAYGLKLGIDFTGGTIIEVEYNTARPAKAVVTDLLGPLNLDSLSIQEVGDRGYLLRMKAITQEEHDQILSVLKNKGEVTEKRYSSIGPTVGAELARKGLIAIVIVVIMIIIYIALAFWGIGSAAGTGHGIQSWKYGLVAVVTLMHDIIIPTGVYAVLGQLRGTEVDALFLTALLTILGLSVNDTIVIFDRVRENLKNKISPHFEITVGKSLEQTFARSLITSLTIVLVMLAVYLFGGETTRDFALVMTIGMAVGTYSSLFLAAPLLVEWEKLSRK